MQRRPCFPYPNCGSFPPLDIIAGIGVTRCMAEYYRQFAFVSSVLAGFAFTFYATLLSIDRQNRAVSWTALLSVAASICFLAVTLGTTFSAARVARMADGAELPPVLQAQQAPLSVLFLGGILLLLTSFAFGGWIRSRRLGIATTILSVFGALAVGFALSPFLEPLRQ